MMNRGNYKSCAHFNERIRACRHPERHAWSDMGSCNDCNGCPLDCMELLGRPDECPHGQPRGMNTLGGAE